MKKIRKDDINLLEAYAYKTPFYEKMKPHVIYFLMPMIFACLCIVIYILVFTNMLGHNQSLLQQNKAELTSLQSTSEELMSTADYQAYIDNKNTYETLKDMQKVITIVDRKEAIRTACMFAQKGDVILVAGKGHENYQEIEGIKHHFDDKEILQDIFENE